MVMAVVLISAAPVAAQEETEEYIVSTALVAEGFTAPVAMTSDANGRLFIVDQVGTIWLVSAGGEMMEKQPFLDLSGLIAPLNPGYDERGVLGMALHPDFVNNGRFFVYYSAPLRPAGPAGWDHTNVVAEFNMMADNPNQGDLASQRIILQIDQPQFNHNSGHIAFGPDGYLYIPIGDGGGADDTDEGHTPGLGNGQDTTNLHGSVLRIDVNDPSTAYTIPADNPFVGEDDIADEIYAYGFRNPYHISFDREAGTLIAADAGQNLYEEVDVVTSGGNYGWNIKEGSHCFNPQDADVELPECASTGARGEPLVDPVIEYGHDQGIVVVGGYMYRGTMMPDLTGYYIFGDYSATGDTPDGVLFWGEPSDEAGGAWEWGSLQVEGMGSNHLGAYLLGVGEDSSGELYLLTSTSGPSGETGKVWKLMPASTEAPSSEGTNGSMETVPQPEATP
jgi:glucose/arabinose dehydrogenase